LYNDCYNLYLVIITILNKELSSRFKKPFMFIKLSKFNSGLNLYFSSCFNL